MHQLRAGQYLNTVMIHLLVLVYLTLKHFGKNLDFEYAQVNLVL